MSFSFVLLFCGIIFWYFISIAIMTNEDTQINDLLKNYSRIIEKDIIHTLEINIAKFDWNLQKKVVLEKTRKLTVTAENQVTHEKRVLNIPVMTLKGRQLYADYGIVDELTAMTGSSATIFQMIPGGMLRISTSVMLTNGSRAIGTFIPDSSPVYAAISGDRTFKGRALVAGRWFITIYEPLYDQDNNLTGALFSGIDQTNTLIIKELKETLEPVNIIKSSYMHVIDKDGVEIYHPDAKMIGMIRNTPVFKKIIEMKTGSKIDGVQQSAAKGKTGSQIYYFFKYIESFDWILIGIAYKDEYYEQSNYIILAVFGSVVIGLIITLIIAYLISGGIMGSIGSLSSFIRGLIDKESGRVNLSVRMEIEQKNEITSITNVINNLIDHLGMQVSEVDEAALSIVDLSEESIKLFEGTVSEKAANLNESIKNIENETRIAATGVEEASSSMEEMTRNMDSVSKNMDKNAAAVSQTASSLEEMARNISNIAKMSEKTKNISDDLKTHSVRGKESVIQLTGAINKVSEYSRKIINVLALISEITRETNILAINAAIESVHAGSAGKGFSIVAEKIRNLSEDTNIQTKEIRNTVENILKQIQETIELAGKAGEGLDTIEDFTSQNSRVISQLNTAVMEQASGAEEIMLSTKEMVKITEDVKRSISEQDSAAREFEKEMREIRDTVMKNRNSITSHYENFGGLMKALEAIHGNFSKNKDLVDKLNKVVSRFIVNLQD